MAVVVLGGLLTSLALNMVVVPVLYMRYGTDGRAHPDAQQPRV
jgi:Cu/Ag efflux pump CusA